MATEQQIERAASRQDWMHVLNLDPTTAVSAADVTAAANELAAKFVWSKELTKCIRDAKRTILADGERSITKCRVESLVLNGASQIIAQFIVRPDHSLYMTSFIPSAPTQPVERPGPPRVQIRIESPPPPPPSLPPPNSKQAPDLASVVTTALNAFN